MIASRHRRLPRADFRRRLASARISGFFAIFATTAGLTTPPAKGREHLALNDVRQRARPVFFVAALIGSISSRPTRPHPDVGDPDVLDPDAEIHQQVEAGQRRGTGARGHQLDLLDLLADQGQAVEDRRADHDRRAVLVVVEHRDVHALAQLGFDVEALGRLDVLQVDAAESGFHRGDHVDQLVRVALGELDVEDVDAGEFLEQAGLALHHRLGRQRADVAEAEHRRAVGHHADQVAAGSQFRRRGGIGDDGIAGRSHARRVSQRQIALVGEALGRHHRNLSRRGPLVILEGGGGEILLFVGHRGYPTG